MTMQQIKITLFFYLLVISVAAQPLPTQVVEGRMTRLEVGLDSFLMDLHTPQGMIRLHRFPNLDSLDPEGRRWLQQRLASPVGRSWPSYTDVGSNVRAVRLNREALLVDYKVTQAGPCWLLILGSYPKRKSAEKGAEKARLAGFGVEIIESGQYPPLRPGYFVCLGGAATDAASAQEQVKMARQKGWKDAYTRRLH